MFLVTSMVTYGILSVFVIRGILEVQQWIRMLGVVEL